MRLSVLIVDDEPLARERIRRLLGEEAPDVEIMAECASGRSAIAAIQQLHPDVVFLDVQMPGLDGFHVIEAVGVKQMPVTVFVTAYDEYALRAFEAHALDYLLKPFDEKRFRQTLQRTREAVGHRLLRGMDERLSRLVDGIGEAAPRHRRFITRTGSRIGFVLSDDITWIEAEGNYIRLHTGERSHLVRESISKVEEQLDPHAFVRIHRSTIVKADRVAELESLFQGEYMVVLRDGTQLKSSRSYREALERAFGLGA